MKYFLPLLLVAGFCTAYAQSPGVPHPAMPLLNVPAPSGLGNYGYVSPAAPPGNSSNRATDAGLRQYEQDLADYQRSRQQVADTYRDLHELQAEEQAKKEETRRAQLREQAYQYAVNCYSTAFTGIKAMLEGKEIPSLKQAVFLTENAFLENTLQYTSFTGQINKLSELCRKQQASGADSHLALYKVLCDTLPLYDDRDKVSGLSMPLQYDFEDYMGNKDWTKMFVDKLLKTRTGNCHSMPLLYKILADELGVEAYLSFAPNHSYIQHRDNKGVWYNLELTNGRYVSESFLMASGYIKAPALKNRIYLDTLSPKQTIAHCLVDLAQGYAWKFGPDEFVVKCCDTALYYYPNDIHALMTKADALAIMLHQQAIKAGKPTLAQLPGYPELYTRYQQVNALYNQIESLGYIPMPKEQYEAWLSSVAREQQRQGGK